MVLTYAPITIYLLYYSFLLLKEVSTCTSSDANNLRFGLYFAISWLLMGFVRMLLFSSLLVNGMFAGNMVMDFIVVTIGCYVSAKKYHMGHDRLQVSWLRLNLTSANIIDLIAVYNVMLTTGFVRVKASICSICGA